MDSMQLYAFADAVVRFLGTLSMLAFFIVIVSDFLVDSVDASLQKVLYNKRSKTSKLVKSVWTKMRDAYEDFREFIDRLSVYSRPRPFKHIGEDDK